MKLKDWINFKMPSDEIIRGASYVPKGDNPVIHPIGVYPSKFDDELIYSNKDVNSKLCYHNVNPWCYRGTRKRKRVIRRLSKYDDFMTKEGYSVGESIPMENYISSLTEHKFCVSPQGNGIDCHRHYETILTKGIPIIQIPNEEYSNKRWGTNSYMEKYEDLPVIWTRHFRDLKQEYLEEKYLEFLEKEFDFEKMNLSYWLKKSSTIKTCITYWNRYHNLAPPIFPQELQEKESEYIPPEPIDTEVKIEDAPIEKVTNIISSTASDVDVDTLVCINSCEKDFHHLSLFKESELYKKMQESENVGILEFYRGHNKTDFEKGKILLPGDERYDKLHIKTYDMIKWCIANLKFNSLVKLDCNFLTYNHVGERTKKRICGADKVEKLIYKRHRKSYDGTNGRMFFLKDFRAWAEQKQIITLLEEPNWLKDELWYYCGKAYKVRYDFAKFIATSDRCKRIVGQHDVKNASGYHPFAVEDVMIGRMHEAFLESEE